VGYAGSSAVAITPWHRFDRDDPVAMHVLVKCIRSEAQHLAAEASRAAADAGETPEAAAARMLRGSSYVLPDLPTATGDGGATADAAAGASGSKRRRVGGVGEEAVVTELGDVLRTAEDVISGLEALLAPRKRQFRVGGVGASGGGGGNGGGAVMGVDPAATTYRHLLATVLKKAERAAQVVAGRRGSAVTGSPSTSSLPRKRSTLRQLSIGAVTVEGDTDSSSVDSDDAAAAPLALLSSAPMRRAASSFPVTSAAASVAPLGARRISGLFTPVTVAGGTRPVKPAVAPHAGGSAGGGLDADLLAGTWCEAETGVFVNREFTVLLDALRKAVLTRLIRFRARQLVVTAGFAFKQKTTAAAVGGFRALGAATPALLAAGGRASRGGGGARSRGGSGAAGAHARGRRGSTGGIADREGGASAAAAALAAGASLDDSALATRGSALGGKRPTMFTFGERESGGGGGDRGAGAKVVDLLLPGSAADALAAQAAALERISVADLINVNRVSAVGCEKGALADARVQLCTAAAVPQVRASDGPPPPVAQPRCMLCLLRGRRHFKSCQRTPHATARSVAAAHHRKATHVRTLCSLALEPQARPAGPPARSSRVPLPRPLAAVAPGCSGGSQSHETTRSRPTKARHHLQR